MNMKTLSALVMFVLLAGLCLPAHANDSYTEGVGGGMMQIRGHPTVVMESAKISIRLASAQVECNYVMHNTGDALDVLIGFPERSEGGYAKEGFKDFRSYVDDQEVPVKPLPALENEIAGGFDRFWVKEVHFAPGQTRSVRNTYIGGKGGDVVGYEWFEYVVSTAACWKGTIADIRVSVDLSDMGPDFQISKISPSGYERSENEIVWHWQNIEPQQDIRIDFITYYMDIWVDDAHYWTVHGQDDCRPSISTGVLTAGLPYIADWLDLEAGALRADGENKVTLTGKGKTAAFVAGQDTALVDGQNIALGVPTRWSSKERILIVPVKPVIEAFGFAFRFDPKTKHTHMHNPEAPDATKPPRWLTRVLTDDDLQHRAPAELRRNRNEIFASHGREFKDQDLQQYFHAQPWYQPDPNYSDALLTDTDRKNIAFIAQTEKKLQTKAEEERLASQRGATPGAETQEWQDLVTGMKRWWADESSGRAQAPDPLTICFNSDNERLRFEAAWVLAWLGDARAVTLLIEMLKSNWLPKEIYTSSCIDAMKEFGDTRAIEPLLPFLKNDLWFVRIKAAEALRKLGDQRGTEYLQKCLKEGENEERKAAAVALEQR